MFLGPKTAANVEHTFYCKTVNYCRFCCKSLVEIGVTSAACKFEAKLENAEFIVE